MQEKKQRAKKKEKTKKGKSTSSAAQVWALIELSDKIEEKINEQNGDSNKGKT